MSLDETDRDQNSETSLNLPERAFRRHGARRHLHRLLAGAAAVAVLAACQHWGVARLEPGPAAETSDGEQTSRDSSLASQPSAASRAAVVDALARGSRLPAPARASLDRFYRAQDYRTAWFYGGVLRPAAVPLLGRLDSCPTSSLPPELQARSLIERVDGLLASGGDEPEVAALDRDLSAAFLVCIAALRRGVPGVVPADYGWEMKAEGPDEVTLLAAVLDRAKGSEVALGKAFKVPRHPQHRRLSAALARYHRLAEAGGWPVDLAVERTLEPGDAVHAALVVKLRRRLVTEGFLEPGAKIRLGHYDGPLVTAVRAYQGARGLEVDGKLGARTVASLNVSVEERIERLQANLQRSLWLPEASAGIEVLVNIPAFRLDVLRDGRPVHRQKVVVGRSDWQTPIFRDAIEMVVVNPAWNVPASIASDEIVPRLAEDPGYLAKQGMEVLSGWGPDAELVDPQAVDWAAVEGNNLRFRQAPGPRNALGRIKFLFPNPHSVYLHDTPSRAAFARTERARSHGCVRVEDPMGLARALLPEDLYQTAVARLESGERATLSLPHAIPVQLIYMTAWAAADGSVEFFDDVYAQDPRLEAAVARWDAIPIGERLAKPATVVPDSGVQTAQVRPGDVGDVPVTRATDRG